MYRGLLSACIPLCALLNCSGAELVSILPNGQPYAPSGGILSVSDDGRYILFHGPAASTNQPLYVRDRILQSTQLVTSVPVGAPAVLSGDGHTVIATYPASTDTGVSSFGWYVHGNSGWTRNEESDVENPIAASYGLPDSLRTDLNGDRIIYVLVVGQQRCETYVQTHSTITSQGIQRFIRLNPYDYMASLSSDGQWATSLQQDLTPGSNSPDRIIVENLATGDQTVLPGTEDFWADSPGQAAVSGDGAVATYLGYFGNGFGVLAYDRVSGTTARVDVSASGASGNGYIANPSISTDGNNIEFISSSTNLVPGVTDGNWHAYVVNRITHAVKMVSLSAIRSPVSSSGVLSGNGQYVAAYSGDKGIDPKYPSVSGGAYLFSVAAGKQ